MFRNTTSLCVLALAGLSAAHAQAAILITADPADVNATPAAMVQVPVYLIETDADLGRIAAEGGLVAASFSVTIASGNGAVVSFAPTAAFDFANPVPLADGLEIQLANFANAPITPEANQLLLGTLTVQAGTTTVFHLDDNNPMSDETMTLNGTDPLDGALLGTDLTVSVPEPTTVAALLPTTFALLRRRRKA